MSRNERIPCASIVMHRWLLSDGSWISGVRSDVRINWISIVDDLIVLLYLIYFEVIACTKLRLTRLTAV